MRLRDIQNQALQLPVSDRWQLVHALLKSLQQESSPNVQRGNLSRLRGIAKNSTTLGEIDAQEDYVTYLTEKYR